MVQDFVPRFELQQLMFHPSPVSALEGDLPQLGALLELNIFGLGRLDSGSMFLPNNVAYASGNISTSSRQIHSLRLLTSVVTVVQGRGLPVGSESAADAQTQGSAQHLHWRWTPGRAWQPAGALSARLPVLRGLPGPSAGVAAAGRLWLHGLEKPKQ